MLARTRGLNKKFCMNCLYFQDINKSLLKYDEDNNEKFQLSMKSFGKCRLFLEYAVKCREDEKLCTPNAIFYKEINLFS
jgi:hypothetical protein